MSPRAVFLERASYRRRRLRDGARLLPVVGLVAVMIPLLWPQGRSAAALVYLFAVWAGLVLGAAVLARSLGRDEGAAQDD